jgi:hypothetical protein
MDYIVPPRWESPKEIPGTRCIINGPTHADYKCTCEKIFTQICHNIEKNKVISCGRCELSTLSKAYYHYRDSYEEAIGMKILGIRLKPVERKSRSRNIIEGLFLCHCGKQFSTSVCDVKRGQTRSCGCFRTWQNAPYYGEIDQNPTKKKIMKAAKIVRQESVRHKYKVSISEKFVAELIMSNCYWTGLKPQRLFFTQILGETPFYINGIDRVNPKKQYTKTNVVPCSKKANFLKGAFAKDEFLTLAKKVTETNEYRIRNNDSHTTGKVLPVRYDTRACKESKRTRQEQTRGSGERCIRRIHT